MLNGISNPTKWIVDNPKFVFFVSIGKMSLYLIHLLYLFYIKLFSQSETIFTNDEHKILGRLSLIFALFDLFKNYVN